ncbi:restriction endonuclease [Serratia sp. IR-2025]|uniref:restriction endonuclease n=1 Tax=Serratia TaxID=613 RepID=UPI0009A8E324|nr:MULTISPECIES: restriction endonuclease [Serratia]NGD64468.1 restriction endonuclease [Serratia marcescens]WRV72832.1 restriction endonuclease [Serratia sp. K-M0252]
MSKKKTKRVDSEWFKFQEKICEHFISLGAKAETNVTVNGPTTSHDIDILVTSKYLGTEFTWIIEAKHWKSRIPIEKVNALTTVVKNIGADRGFIISKAGFQKGAIDASKFNNISLMTFDELKKNTEHLIQYETIKMHFNRLIILSARYWGHKKRIRQDYNLRSDLGDLKINFSGTILLYRISEILREEKISYPIHFSTVMEDRVGEDVINNFNELNNWLHVNLNHLDRRIFEAEMNMIKNNDFNPNYRYLTAEIASILASENGKRLIDGCFLPKEDLEKINSMSGFPSIGAMMRPFLISEHEFNQFNEDENP